MLIAEAEAAASTMSVQYWKEYKPLHKSDYSCSARMALLQCDCISNMPVWASFCGRAEILAVIVSGKCNERVTTERSNE